MRGPSAATPPSGAPSTPAERFAGAYPKSEPKSEQDLTSEEAAQTPEEAAAVAAFVARHTEVTSDDDKGNVPSHKPKTNKGPTQANRDEQKQYGLGLSAERLRRNRELFKQQTRKGQTHSASSSAASHLATTSLLKGDAPAP